MNREILAEQLREVGFEVQLVDWHNNVNESNNLGEWTIKSRAAELDADLPATFLRLHAGEKIYLYGIEEVYHIQGKGYKIQYDARYDG